MTDSVGIEHVLTTTELERDLGVLIATNGKWHEQVAAAVAKANRAFGMLKRTFTSRSSKLWRGLWLQYIRPHVEFATQVLSPQFKGDIDDIKKVQRRVTKHIVKYQRLPYEERLERLELTTLEDRRMRGDLIQEYKIAHGIDQVRSPSTKCRHSNARSRSAPSRTTTQRRSNITAPIFIYVSHCQTMERVAPGDRRTRPRSQRFQEDVRRHPSQCYQPRHLEHNVTTSTSTSTSSSFHFT